MRKSRFSEAQIIGMIKEQEAGMPVALRPGERWSLDFLSDTFGASRKFRILAVNDDAAVRTCASWPTPASLARVARELDALVRIYGKPASIVSDNVLWAE